MATSTKSSVDSVRQGLVSYISRPLSDFNKYEAMEMFELLQNTSHDNKHQMEGFYKVAYQTARKRMDLPKDQFQSLLLRLIGDEDHEKVLDIVFKVEKHYRRDGRGKLERRRMNATRSTGRRARESAVFIAIGSATWGLTVYN